MDAIDEVMSFEVQSEIKESQIEPLRIRKEELKKSIQKQDVAEKKAYQNSKILRGYADRIQNMKNYQEKVSPEILAEFGIDKSSLMKGILTIEIDGIRIKVEAKQSMMKFASKLFVEAKEYERKLSSIQKAKAELKSELESINLKSRIDENKIDSKKIIITREKTWYEKYRWFFTSDRILAIGGRDSSTNNIIISRYTESKDLVFHADLHGSPFFILKDDDPSDTSILEVAQATVIFSRAWKDGYSAGDAYWIHPDQIKRAAPSGTYLPRGSFLIQGSKNYIKNLKIENAIGITKSENQYKVISGPPSAVRRNSIAFVIIVPEKGKKSDIAKKVKSELIKLLESSVDVKKKNLDDFIRAMPTGSGKIISKGFGEQRYKKL
jgi:predicted ribosome quality control (RQC) complex YloA/Tae2 family protein